MDHNPYAPPKAVVADRAETTLWRRSVLLMILFTIVSLGVYYPIWFLRRRKAFNQLESPTTIDVWPPVAFLGLIVVDTLLAVQYGEAIPSPFGGLVGIVRIGVGILMLVQCFRIKDILEDHLSVPEDEGSPQIFTNRVKLSGLLTFFFGIFYLQHIINRDVLTARDAVV